MATLNLRRHPVGLRTRIKTLLCQTPHRTRPARLVDRVSPAVCDVARKGHSGLPGGRVGGGFLMHDRIVFFLSKKGLTKRCELFAPLRNAVKTGGVL